MQVKEAGGREEDALCFRGGFPSANVHLKSKATEMAINKSKSSRHVST